MDFTWAKDYPEIYKICTLFSLTELINPKRFYYRPLCSFIQDGPQCGLVALAMYMENVTKESVDKLLMKAQENGYSFNGEMFSAKDMAELAKDQLDATHLVELYEGPLNCDRIKESLMSGTCILVPYDTEKDNSPGTLNGIKAHWAIIHGAIETENDFYVLARHGKAKNVAIWPLEKLSESNGQLNEVGIYQKQPNIKFKIPEGGVQGSLGLKSKCVLLSPL